MYFFSFSKILAHGSYSDIKCMYVCISLRLKSLCGLQTYSTLKDRADEKNPSDPTQYFIIQLFRQRLSHKSVHVKAYATIPKAIMGNGGFTIA